MGTKIKWKYILQKKDFLNINNEKSNSKLFKKTLKGTSSVFMVFIAPNDEAAAGVRIFFENHIEFMKEKSH